MNPATDQVDGDFPDWVVDTYQRRGCQRPERGGTHDTRYRVAGGWKVVTWDRRGPRERIIVRVIPEPRQDRATLTPRRIRARRAHTPRGRTASHRRATNAGRDDGDDHPGEPPAGPPTTRRILVGLLPPFPLALASVSAALVARMVWA